MSNSLMKKIVAVVVTLGIVGVGYYGTYLPLIKSRAFISAMRTTNQLRSFEEFEQTFAVPLTIPSPSGQEELVRNTSNSLLNLLPSLPEDEGGRALTARIVEYIERNYAPLIQRGRGMSFGQNLYLLGALNEVALVKTRDPKYLVAAKRYFLMGLERGPKRPQFLYGMFDVYRAEGDVVKTQEIANQILAQWPTDERTRQALAEFLERANASRGG